ncbi:MAG: hypothetical protein PF636_04065 [Actinomycetota bacterium]|jgi:hypothetical protein|nr:hypothetical protein [Actinomycetota bacterium]
MTIFHVSSQDALYDDFADVLYVKLAESDDTFGRETPSGLIVHFSRSTGAPTGITVMDYCALSEDERHVFQVDTESPFEVHIEDTSIACMG